jgi:hypothetical protein
MAKTKISEYSSTASNNTDIDGISIAEGMAPSNVNNAIRELMSQLKDWQSGSVSQDMYVNGAFTASGNAVLSADLSVSGKSTVGGVASFTALTAITSGTYGRTSNTITVTSASHGFQNGQVLNLEFSAGTGGTATSGVYTISNVATNTFDVTDTASGSISGTPSVTITRGGLTCTGAVVGSNLSVGGNASIVGTLSAGATSLGAVTFSGAAVMSSTLSVTGNATVGSSTTNSHTLNGSLTVGTSTSNTVTLNTLLSAGGGTGSSGQVLKSRGTSDTPQWGVAESTTLLGTIATTTGTSQALSVDLTSYKFLKLVVSRVSHNSGSSRNLRLNSITGPDIAASVSSSNYLYGTVDIDITNEGTFGASVHGSTTSGVTSGTTGSYAGESGITTASTSVTVAISGGSFDGGNVYVYGIR